MLPVITPMLARMPGSAAKPEAHPAQALQASAKKPFGAFRLATPSSSSFDAIAEDPSESAQAATSPEAAASRPLAPRPRVRPNWMTLEPIADE